MGGFSVVDESQSPQKVYVKHAELFPNSPCKRERDREAEVQPCSLAGDYPPHFTRRGILFSETLKTLSRLISSSYRRCHWKSAAEVIFPLLQQHLTYASHRTWKLFTKKAIYLAMASWRRLYSDSVLQAR